ncbi:hypothetical protein [Absidia glauca]|uniref:Uncharacterized protein n=1 Tax=Absidia glauca TaxID=4829 RepID=A0A168NN83_ABSGL|nr:hypothetical protein [Absidia glauca]
MSTNYLQRLSFHKLEVHQPSESLHSFVLVRNSLLHSIQTQQQDSWLDACFDELTPDTTTMDLTLDSTEPLETIIMDEDDDDDDMDMLLLDDDSDEENGPVSPEESSLQPPPYRSRPSPAFFIPMDDDIQEEEEDAILSAADNHHLTTPQHPYGPTDDTRHHKLHPTTSFLSV